MSQTRLYLVGSLRDPNVPAVGNALREMGFDVFDDWFAAGPRADDEWQAYETKRGRTYVEALQGHAAQHVFDYDLEHLQDADAVVLIYPAGKSAFLELGYAIGAKKKGYIYLTSEPERWDVMAKFASGVHTTIEGLVEQVRKDFAPVYYGEPGSVIEYRRSCGIPTRSGY
jgi:nucleoside 2-deoxyribosyltransferase